jgi:hypothetical protein
VDGREGAEGVERLVTTGEAVAGFLVCPVSTSEIMRVADAGQLLPAKVGLLFCVPGTRLLAPVRYRATLVVSQATFFHPKPKDNLLLRLWR